MFKQFLRTFFDLKVNLLWYKIYHSTVFSVGMRRWGILTSWLPLTSPLSNGSFNPFEITARCAITKLMHSKTCKRETTELINKYWDKSEPFDVFWGLNDKWQNCLVAKCGFVTQGDFQRFWEVLNSVSKRLTRKSLHCFRPTEYS